MWSEAEEMPEREVAMLEETKEQRRVEAQKASVGRMRWRGRLLLTGAL